MLIVMSDVYLDQAVVLERLADVFAGYEGVGAEMLRCGKELRQASPSASPAALLAPTQPPQPCARAHPAPAALRTQPASARTCRPRAAYFVFVLCGNFVSPLGASSHTKRSQLRALYDQVRLRGRG